jgi:hypothetical protein
MDRPESGTRKLVSANFQLVVCFCEISRKRDGINALPLNLILVS